MSMSTKEETIQSIRALLTRQEIIDNKLHSLQMKQLKIQGEIQFLVCSLPMIYGKCKKELVCHHQSDEFNCYEKTVINPGDIIEFFRFPLENSIRIKPQYGEYFDIPYSEEYFDFFTPDPNEYPIARTFKEWD
jgi:hypothetical protein